VRVTTFRITSPFRICLFYINCFEKKTNKSENENGLSV